MSFTIDPSADSIWERWHAKHPMDGPFTEQDLNLMASVRRALASGLFYNRDVDDFVAEELGVTKEQREIQPKHHAIEGGCFGYEVYFARKNVERNDEIQANKAALVSHRWSVGQKIGKLKCNYKLVRGCVITSISMSLIELSGVLGNRQCTVKMEPRRLPIAIKEAC